MIEIKNYLEQFGKLSIVSDKTGVWKCKIRNRYYTISAFPECSLKQSLLNLKAKIEKNEDLLNYFKE